MKSFITVNRYICFNCKKEFKTATRHNCKRDPDKKNCYTCKHNNGWNEIDVEHEYDCFGYDVHKEWSVDCARENEHTAPDLASMNYELNCPDWEMKEEEEQA